MPFLAPLYLVTMPVGWYAGVMASRASNQEYDVGIQFNGNPVKEEPIQLPLFARKAVLNFGIPSRTADALGQIQADDDFVYYVKDDARGRPIRASEWLGTRIAEMSGVAAPTPAIIALQSGRLVFGSRRISGVSDATETARYLLAKTTNELGECCAHLAPLLSSIYALDLAINNVDRNLTNYLSVADYESRHLYAADYGRALFYDEWDWARFPDSSHTTVSAGRILRRLHGYDATAAHRTLDRLTSIPVSAVESIFEGQPADWLAKLAREKFLSDWAAGMWLTRIMTLRGGLDDGSLL